MLLLDPILEITKGQLTAAWVSAMASVGQAIFSVLAIVAAGRLASGQRAHETRLREQASLLRARDNAIRIASAMTSWADKARRWLDALDASGPESWVPLSQIADNLDVIAVPQRVIDLSGKFRQLGPGAHPVQRAVVAQAKLREAAPEIAGVWAQATLRRGADPGGPAQYILLIRTYCEAVIAAEAAVLRVRDS
jgi:hypothetical protein